MCRALDSQSATIYGAAREVYDIGRMKIEFLEYS